jgi:hypothetical protein
MRKAMLLGNIHMRAAAGFVSIAIQRHRNG